MYTDKHKESFLTDMVRDYYNQGDSYYAYKNKKNKWHFGYSNDYPLQHGSGENFILPDNMVSLLMSKLNVKSGSEEKFCDLCKTNKATHEGLCFNCWKKPFELGSKINEA